MEARNYVQSGSESLRIVRGVVTAEGTIIVGSGFTVSHPANGQYTINFNPYFNSAPAVSATVENGGRIDYYGIASTAGVRYFYANIRTFIGHVASGPVAQDAPFHFIAIGSR